MKRFAVYLLGLLLALTPALAMNNPGPFSLGAFIVSSPATQCTPASAPVNNLSGLTATSLQVRFAYGSGGTQTNVFVQTSVDQGQSFFDIANIQFTTTSGVELINLSGLNSVTTPVAPTNLALAAGTVLNGPIGDRLQVCVVSTGTYSGQTLVSVTGVAR